MGLAGPGRGPARHRDKRPEGGRGREPGWCSVTSHPLLPLACAASRPVTADVKRSSRSKLERRDRLWGGGRGGGGRRRRRRDAAAMFVQTLAPTFGSCPSEVVVDSREHAHSIPSMLSGPICMRVGAHRRWCACTCMSRGGGRGKSKRRHYAALDHSIWQAD